MDITLAQIPTLSLAIMIIAGIFVIGYSWYRVMREEAAERSLIKRRRIKFTQIEVAVTAMNRKELEAKLALTTDAGEKEELKKLLKKCIV